MCASGRRWSGPGRGPRPRAALLENPRIGVIHLDRRGQILEVNDRARRLLRRGQGLSDRDGVLRARQPADQRRLERLVAGALPTAGAVPVSGSMLLARAQRDAGHRPGLTRSKRERLKELEREVRELKRANEILRKASAYFGQAELHRRGK